MGDDAQPIAQPLDGRPGNEHTPLQRVGHGSILTQLPGDGRQQSALRSNSLRACIEEKETAGTVGILGLARRIAGLTEEGRLLIARRASYRHLRTQQPRLGEAICLG